MRLNSFLFSLIQIPYYNCLRLTRGFRIGMTLFRFMKNNIKCGMLSRLDSFFAIAQRIKVSFTTNSEIKLPVLMGKGLTEISQMKEDLISTRR